MSRNYMRVTVVNESNATLRFRHASTTGDWTPGGWQPSQIPETPPGAGLHWQAEGEAALDIPLSGVEARAWYDVVNASGVVIGELYIFANCPWVESQYGNTFHVHAPKGYYASYVDADGQKKGNRSFLEIRFRNTQRVEVRGFIPSKNGFQFSNKWSDQLPVISVGTLWNQLLKAMPGDLGDLLGIATAPEDFVPLTHADAGLCGGMVYAAMDYFYAQQLPPIAAKDAAGTFVSPTSADDPVFKHIRQRLLDSFDFTGRGHRWLSYTSPLYPDDDEGPLQTAGLAKGKAWATYREEWPRIRQLLDAGKLAPLGLVQSAEFDIGDNHQVLAYAYRQDGQVVQLWIYDPNIPKQKPPPAIADDAHLIFDITDTANGITVTRRNQRPEDSEKRIYAILYLDNYQPHVAPLGRPIPPNRPKVVNLVVADAESITTGGVAASEKTNHCGDVLQFGQWTSRTTVKFVAQTSGYMDPVLKWSVGGVPIAPGPASVGMTFGGAAFQIDCHLSVNGRALTLSSRSGDTYNVPVAVDVSDALGNSGHADGAFDVAGTYEGMRIEDVRAQAQCIARTVPVPADIQNFTVPKPGPDPDPRWNPEVWGREVLARLDANPDISPNTRAAIANYVALQVEVPAFRASANDIAGRNFRRVR